MRFFDKLFKRNTPNQTAETGLHLKADTIEAILKSHEQLRGIGKNLIGLRLFVLPKNQVEELAYERLLLENSFKVELQRALDNQFVQLADNWTFSYEIVSSFPENSAKINEVLAIQLLDKGSVKHKEATLTTLVGKTWKKSYDLQPKAGALNIGRGKNPVLESGRIHTNQVAFIDPTEETLDAKIEEISRHVSRFHAAIKYDANQMKYCLYLAKGVFTNGHNTKILRGESHDEQKIDVNNDQIAYILEDNDQIQFNRKAVLEFRLKA